jgi:hypothetical protein
MRITCTQYSKSRKFIFCPLSKGHNSFIHKQSLPHQALTSGRGEKEKKERERRKRRRKTTTITSNTVQLA